MDFTFGLVSRRFIYILFNLTLLWINVKGGAFMQAAMTERLVREVFRHYNPALVPSLGGQETVRVHLGLSLLHLLNLDHELGVTQLYMLERYEWTDPRLAWNAVEYGGVDLLVLPHEHVWTPDVALYNEIPVELTSIKRPDVVLHSNGSVQWLHRVTKAVDCFSDQETFTWTCVLLYGSWNYPGYLLNLVPSPEGIDTRSLGLLRNGLMLTDASMRQVHNWTDSPDHSTTLAATLHIVSLFMNFDEKLDQLGGSDPSDPSLWPTDAADTSDEPSLLEMLESLPDFEPSMFGQVVTSIAPEEVLPDEAGVAMDTVSSTVPRSQAVQDATNGAMVARAVCFSGMVIMVMGWHII